MDERGLAMEIARSLGVEPSSADPLLGGNQNHVVRVRSDDDDIVVRFARDPDPSDDPFDAEAWCLRAATRAGLRTSELVARGWLSGVSYLVASYVPGSPAEPDDLRGWNAIGAFTSALRGVPTHDAPPALFTRFGRDLERAWDEHLSYNLAALGPNDPLIALGVYPRSRRRDLQDVVSAMSARKLPQGLVHGGAARRNLVRAEDGYTVIDWGTAATGPVMWGDLERIFRWHVLGDAESPVSSAAWDQVLDGAGLDRADAEPIVRSLAALHAIDVVRWAVDQRPDRLGGVATEAQRVLAAMIFKPRHSSS